MGAGWTAERIGDQAGKTVVVTGASNGLGFETARVLAGKRAKVVMAVRSMERGQAAAAKLKEAQPDADVRVMQLDLSELASIRAFAEAYRAEYGTLDVLVNNAGVMTPPYRRTADGFELQIGCNHLGHYALTGLLLECLTRAPQARVVTVSSKASHQGARIDFDNLDGSKGYSRWRFYGQSKLANLHFARLLQEKLRANGHDTLSIACHPGIARSNLGSFGSGKQVNRFVQFVMNLVSQPTGMGALPSLYAATEPGVPGGSYIGPDGRGGSGGYPIDVTASLMERLYNAETAKRLWQVSEELTGVRYSV